MDYTVCSRETERDYTWDDAHASSSLASLARDTLAPAFEGSLTTSRFATLLRCSGSPSGVILGISVSTKRIDFRNRPIRTMAFLRAENPDAEKLLASFFSECLFKSDAKTLYDAESAVAKAVESLYQTKMADEFIRFCRSLPAANGSGPKPVGRWAIPRGYAGARRDMAESIPALVDGDKPFLVALTDRLPTDVFASLGSMFDRGPVWIFSKATTAEEPIPGGPLNTRAVAAAIGGTILLALLVAAIGGPCSRRSGDGEAVASTNSLVRPVESRVIETNAQANGGGGEAVAPTNRIGRAVDGGVVATNAPARGGIGSTSIVPAEGRSGDPVRKARKGGVFTNAAPTSAEASAPVTNVIPNHMQ